MGITTAKQHLQKMAIERIKSIAALPYRTQMAALHNLDAEEFWQYQAARLRWIYQDAVKHVPYYRDQPDLYPRKLPKGSHPLEILSQLPILNKSVVKAETERFWREPALLGTAQHTTGGTTGSPLRVRASLMERGYTQAILDDRYAHIVGTSSPRILRMSGYLDRENSEGRIFQAIPGTKYAYISIYSLSSANRDEIVSYLESFRPEVIHGYASAIHQLALLFKDIPLPPSIEPFIVVSTSETLLPHQRKDIEAYLRTQVFDEYGSQEGQHLILECEHRTKHIHPARGVVEILEMQSDNHAAAGETGRVVVTGLMSRSMPLIRYALGDTAVSAGNSAFCQCGLQWPSVDTIYGRMEDLVVTRDGRRIPLLAHSTLKDLSGLKEAQIFQSGFESFEYRIVPATDGTFDADEVESHIRRELEARVGQGLRVTFKYFEGLERTASGKLRAVVVDIHSDDTGSAHSQYNSALAEPDNQYGLND